MTTLVRLCTNVHKVLHWEMAPLVQSVYPLHGVPCLLFFGPLGCTESMLMVCAARVCSKLFLLGKHFTGNPIHQLRPSTAAQPLHTSKECIWYHSYTFGLVFMKQYFTRLFLGILGDLDSCYKETWRLTDETERN